MEKLADDGKVMQRQIIDAPLRFPPSLRSKTVCIFIPDQGNRKDALPEVSGKAMLLSFADKAPDASVKDLLFFRLLLFKKRLSAADKRKKLSSHRICD